MKNFYILILLLQLTTLFSQNNAFTFNGIDQQIATYTQQSNIDFTNQNFTIEAWVKPAAFVVSANNFEHTILGNDSWDGSGNYGYVLRTGGNKKLEFVFGESTNWHSVVSTNPVFAVDEWAHVAVVRNGTTFTLFANGVQVGQQTFTQNIASAQANLRIAENGNGSNRKFNGGLDEIKIWNTARTLAEVRGDLADTEIPLSLELVVYYKMDQTTGQAVASETSVNLNAIYTPTANINTIAGFFRTYTFNNGSGDFLWTNSSNWVNGYIPNHLLQKNGDIININTNCNFNISNVLTISQGVTLNNLANCFFEFDFYSTGNFIQPIFTINGVVNNYGTIDNNFFNGTFGFTTLVNGTLNSYAEANYFFNRMLIGTNGLVNNTGIIKYSTIESYNYSSQFLNIITGGQLLNQTSGIVESSALGNQLGGTIQNSGVINIENSFSTNGVINNNISGLINSFKDIFNSGTINNNGAAILNLKRFGTNTGIINNYNTVTFEHTATNLFFTNSGTFNNIGQNSEFSTANATSKFVNQATFNYEGIVSNNGIFQIDASGTITSQGAYSQFDNNKDVINSGIFITKNDINNTVTSTFTQNGILKGGGNFQNTLFTNNSVGILSPGLSPGTLNFANG